MSFFIAMFVLLMQFLWRYVEDLVGKGLSAGVVLEVVLYASSSLVPMALPLSVLLSSIMVFGNLAEHNELIALKSAGISLVRIMGPLVWIVLALAGVAFVFADRVLPYSNLKMRALLYDVQNKPPEIVIPEGVFYNELPGYSIKIGARDRHTDELTDILIYDHTENRGNVSVIVARSGFLSYVNEHQYMVLQLYDGSMYQQEDSQESERRREHPMRRHTFAQQTIVFDLTGFGLKRSDESLFKNHYQMMSSRELTYAIDTLDQRLAEQRAGFKQNLLATNYFRRLKKNKDTLAARLPADGLSPDTLMAAQKPRGREQILASALNMARNTQSYVQSEERVVSSRVVWRVKHDIERHRKFTLSVACVALFFIGAPLGAIIRKGGIGMPVVMSVILFVIYYVLGMLGSNSAEQSRIPTWLGMWLATIIYAPLGAYLTSRALRDKVLVDTDRYLAAAARLARPAAKLIRARSIRRRRQNGPAQTPIEG